MKKVYRILGLMSGTSLDGLDIALCIFEQIGNRWKYKIERAETFEYDAELRQKLSTAEHLSGLDLHFLSNEFARICASYVNCFMTNDHQPIDFIASHGQTIFHQPEKQLTVQIGNGAVLAALTGLTTVCDFRTVDVALGGHGAPLVPIGDKLLFDEYAYCLNLGGFANISNDNLEGIRVAYDICPVNIVINELVKERGLSFDPEGSIARKGTINSDLLEQLNNLDFYKQRGPKSLGKEWAWANVIPIIKCSNISLEDKLRSFYEHIAIQIQKCTSRQNGKVLITGGGANNLFLIDLLKDKLRNEIVIPDKNILEFKEALIFAFLGLMRIIEKPNALSSVTGAERDNIGGAIYKPY